MWKKILSNSSSLAVAIVFNTFSIIRLLFDLFGWMQFAEFVKTEIETIKGINMLPAYILLGVFGTIIFCYINHKSWQENKALKKKLKEREWNCLLEHAVLYIIRASYYGSSLYGETSEKNINQSLQAIREHAAKGKILIGGKPCNKASLETIERGKFKDGSCAYFNYKVGDNNDPHNIQLKTKDGYIIYEALYVDWRELHKVFPACELYDQQLIQ